MSNLNQDCHLEAIKQRCQILRNLQKKERILAAHSANYQPQPLLPKRNKKGPNIILFKQEEKENFSKIIQSQQEKQAKLQEVLAKKHKNYRNQEILNRTHCQILKSSLIDEQLKGFQAFCMSLTSLYCRDNSLIVEEVPLTQGSSPSPCRAEVYSPDQKIESNNQMQPVQSSIKREFRGCASPSDPKRAQVGCDQSKTKRRVAKKFELDNCCTNERNQKKGIDSPPKFTQFGFHSHNRGIMKKILRKDRMSKIISKCDVVEGIKCYIL